MKRLLTAHIFPIILIFITLVISLRNYSSGTFLSGWDTLHPEFNFSQQLTNVLTGVWRGDQGLGAVATHSHIGELPRILVLWFLSLLLPLSLLRYAWILGCFIIGPLGVYVFLTKYVFRTPTLVSRMAAFLGSLFYIFNLGTVQHFYVPFEMFTTQYAFLGWLFYAATKYVFEERKKHLLFFAIFAFLATPMAYSALLWYAFAAELTLYLITLTYIEKRRLFTRSSLTLIITLLCVNAFWLLPNWYFYATHAADVPLAHTNRLFSEEAFLHNKQYGNLVDSVVFKNFLFNWNHQMGLRTENILEIWKAHLANPFIAAIGYIGALVVGIGIIIAVIKRNKIALALFPIALVSLLMIINMNPPFDMFFNLLRDHFSILKEGLRFPWTKFSLLLMFSFSVFFALTFETILRKINFRVIQILTIAAASIILMIYGLPMFNGFLIDPAMRVKIPDEYFELHDYVNKQPEVGRLAPLPMHSIWGWEYYDWGYQGAGFLWFGLNVPVLARDFDRWSPYNEQYYRELSTALYARDVKQVEALADKYQIHYFLLDESVIFPANKPNALWYHETEDLFTQSTKIHLDRTFGKKLKLYTVDLSYSSDSFVQTPSEFLTIGPQLRGGYTDQPALNGTYVTQANNDIVYPARLMIDRYGQIDPINILMTDTQVFLRLTDQPLPNYQISPSWDSDEIYPKVLREYYPEDVAFEKESQLYSQNELLWVGFPNIGEKVLLKNQEQQTKECGTKNEGVSNRRVGEDYVAFEAISDASCDYVHFNNRQGLGQLVIIEAKHVAGLSIRLCITNTITRRCDVYTELGNNPDWQKYAFVVPPIGSGSTGFDVHVNTISIGTFKSENQVRSIQMIPLPYYRLQNLVLTKHEAQPTKENAAVFIEGTAQSSWLYTAKMDNGANENNNLVVLNQAFDSGWLAFQRTNTFPFIKPIGKHILVNNWANGWEIEPSAINNQSSDCLKAESCQLKAYIFFWPQVLEWIGFLLLPVSFLFFIKK